MYRLFVAIALPELLVERLQGLCSGVRDARWARPDQMHLTLRFIGDADGAALHDLCESLALIEAEPFRLTPSGLGHFPPRGPARVLWAGVLPSEPLRRLQAKVEAAAVGLGFEPETRNYAPHITLARFKRPAPSRRIAEYLSVHGAFLAEPFTVDAFHLYSSHLSASGALYTIEASFPFSEDADFLEPSFAAE